MPVPTALPPPSPDTRATPAHVVVNVACTSCGGAIELESEGLQGFWGYRTYNEFFCPHCRKQNHHLTSGVILATRVPAA